MQLSQLSSFLDVAKYGSVTAAAKSAFITQSAVSQAVSSLEKELNVTLFLRTGKQLKLTAIGKRILLPVQLIIDELKLIEHECSLFQDGQASVYLAVTALPTQSIRLVRDFYAAQKGISVVRVPLNGGASEPDVIINATLERNLTDNKQLLLTEEVGLVVPKKHVLYGKSEIELNELRSIPMINLDRSHDFRMNMDYYCKTADFVPIVDREFNTLSELLEAVYAEKGAAFFPFKTWGIEQISPDRIIRITKPRCMRYVYIEKCPTSTSVENAVQTFVDFTVDYFRNA